MPKTAADRPVRVLLVDDDRDDYLLTRDLLDEIPGGGYSLDWVSDYESAVAALDGATTWPWSITARPRTGLEPAGRGPARGVICR